MAVLSRFWENVRVQVLVLADVEDIHWMGGGGKADLLISCGDVRDGVILEAATAFGCSRILAVKGNHDSDTPFPAPIENLHLRQVEAGGLTFGGFEGSWKYKPRGSFLYEQETASELLRTFPRVDILVSHNSPRRTHDREDGIHQGFLALCDYLHEKRPRILLHGHQHVRQESRVEDTQVIGVYEQRVMSLD